MAAVIAEPVSVSAGVAIPGPEYWPMLREICDRHGVLLIADEVINGFGRTGKMFAIEHFGVQPDIITLAKGITSGYQAVGACIVRDHVGDAFVGEEDVTFRHGYTYSGHPAGAAAALANIEIIEREGLVENSAAMGRRLLDRLTALKESPIVGRRAWAWADVRHRAGEGQGDEGVACVGAGSRGQAVGAAGGERIVDADGAVSESDAGVDAFGGGGG